MASDNPNLFKPGQSGNPAGRAKGLERRTRELVGGDGEELVMTLLGIARDTMAAKRDRIEACKVLFDRGWGKARQTVDITGDLSLGQRAERSLAPMTDEQLAIMAALDIELEESNDDPATAPD